MLSQSSVTLPDESIDGVPDVIVTSPQSNSAAPTPPPHSSAPRPNAIRRFSEHFTNSIINIRHRMAHRNDARRMTLPPGQLKLSSVTENAEEKPRKHRSMREGRKARGRGGDGTRSEASDYQPIGDLLAIMSGATAFPQPTSATRLRELLPHAFWLPNHLRDLHSQAANQIRSQGKGQEGTKEHRSTGCNCFKIIHPYSYFRFTLS